MSKLIIFLVCISSINCMVNLDIQRNFGQITASYGYPFEEHFVTTSDGYILRLFRIPHGLNDEYIPGRPAVLLQHGLLDSADDYVVRGSELSPAFYLANNGYDVWASNSRGNVYSRNHTTLDPDTDPEFWDFSFFDMVEDHQSNIEFILNRTNLDTITFVGFSVGTTSMFAGL